VRFDKKYATKVADRTAAVDTESESEIMPSPSRIVSELEEKLTPGRCASSFSLVLAVA